MRRMVRFYDRSLTAALNFRMLALIVFLATIALTVGLYIKVPKGYVPQDDSGLIFGGTRASTDISFDAMKKLQLQAMNDHPRRSGGGGAGLLGRLVRLQCVGQPRPHLHLAETAQRAQRQHPAGGRAAAPEARPHPRPAGLPGAGASAAPRRPVERFRISVHALERGPRARSQQWAPKVVDRFKELPGLADVTTDREQGGLQASVEIDRKAAARLGVRMQDIDSALNDAFSQRQISTIYGARNQYRVILEVDRKYQRDPTDLTHIYVPGHDGKQVPLSAVAHVTRTIAPLVVNHQGQFPSTTITYNLRPRRGARTRHRCDRTGGGGHAPAGYDPRRFRRRRAVVQAQRGGAAAADPGGADRGLYRARRACTRAWCTRSPSSRRCRRRDSARCWR